MGHLRRPAENFGDGDQGFERRVPLHRLSRRRLPRSACGSAGCRLSRACATNPYPLRFARGIGRGGIDRNAARLALPRCKLPLVDADRRVTGHDVAFWKRWLSNSIANDVFWEPLDHTHRLGSRTPPTSFVSGWYDFMVDQLLRDYETLTDAGRPTRLTVGPWVHVSQELQLRQHARHA